MRQRSRGLTWFVVGALALAFLGRGQIGSELDKFTGGGGAPPVAATPAAPGEMAIARFLLHHGTCDAAAAGVAGTAAGESNGDPESVGSGGGGLIGWTPMSSAGPIQPIITGNVRRDMGVQLVDMLAYIDHNGSIGDLNRYCGSLHEAMSAAWRFSAHYERPLVTGSDIRPSVVAWVYATITHRYHSRHHHSRPNLAA